LIKQDSIISSILTISGRGLGKKQKALFEDFSIPFPPDLGDGEGLTLRDLITKIVLNEIEAFIKRQEKRLLVKVLSPAEIDQGIKRGKISLGGEEMQQEVKPDVAVGTALQAFEDGLYLVVVDGVEKRNLDEQVYIQPGSRITFIRLVFLAGA
jgi:hypothetical protein